MKRWNARFDGNADMDTEVEAPRVDRFLAEIAAVCRRYRLSIAHEDCGGTFIVEGFTEENINWLNAADIDLDLGELT